MSAPEPRSARQALLRIAVAALRPAVALGRLVVVIVGVALWILVLPVIDVGLTLWARLRRRPWETTRRERALVPIGPPAVDDSDDDDVHQARTRKVV